MLKIAIYPSHHGFGHASRMAALADELIHYGAFVHIRSSKPDFLFRRLDPHYYHKSDLICDVGVRHGPNLDTDLEATKTALLGLFGRRAELVESEVEFLRREQVDLIIADIPFLIIEAATYARVPVFAVSNFDWLFIYENLFAADLTLRPVLNTISGLYQRVDHAFVPPFSSRKSMAAFRNRERVGLIAGRKLLYNDIRSSWGLPPQARILTCMFGGEGAMVFDLEKVCEAFQGIVVSTREGIAAENHIQVRPDDDFLDLIHASDVILTKPGYSTFAEAAQFGKFILFHSRRDYPEEQVLIQGLNSYPQKLQLDSFDMTLTQWRSKFEIAESSLSTAKKIPNQNTRIAALIVKHYLDVRYPGKKIHSVFDAGSNNLNYTLHIDGETEPVHVAHLKTGLGHNYITDRRGGIRLHQNGIESFKQAFSAVMACDMALDSSKMVLGTGIARTASNLDQLTAWLGKRWRLPYRLLSTREEAQYNYLAARALIPSGHTALIADIGGFSTELILADYDEQFWWQSIGLGLLSLRRKALSGLDPKSLIKDGLSTVQDATPDLIIATGLSASYLAKVILAEPYHTPMALHRRTISVSLLRQAEEVLAKAVPPEWEHLMIDPGAVEILKLSIRFFIVLLDKYRQFEFVVCYYGISAGYMLASQDRKRRHPRIAP